MKLSRKNALLGMLATGLSGCAGASSQALPGLFGGGGSGPGGRAPASSFIVTKGRGAPRYSTARRPDSAATAGGSAVLTYTDAQSKASAQANQSTGSANLYGPSGTFAGQLTTGAVSGGYAVTLTHANGTTYNSTMPDPAAVPNGTSTYNGVTFTIDQNAGTARAVYGNTTVTASYDAAKDSITINLPDGSVGLYANVTNSAPAAAPAAAHRAPQQAAGGPGILLCALRILVAVIVTVITIIVIAIAIGICASLAWNLIGLAGCIIAVLVAFVFVIITLFIWITVWVWCAAPPPPPPPGLIAAQPVQATVALRGYPKGALPA